MLETSIAGSLPKLEWLAEPEKLWARWAAEGETLSGRQQDAALLWIKLQEESGIDIVTDGEQFRIHFMAMAFAEALNAEARELEAAGVDLIQFDEPAFNEFTDDVNEWGIAALEKAADGLRCQTAVHICYGYGIKANLDWKATLGSEWRQYEGIFPAINRSRIGQVSLECANSRVPLSLLGLLTDKVVMVGVIDVATDTIETPEEVAATIEAAMEFVDPERLSPCTNCGMAPLPRAVATGKLAALGAGTRMMRKKLAG